MEDVLIGILAISIQAGSVIIIASLGELVGQLTGVFNMGLEGTMALGALAAFVVVQIFPNPYVGLLAGILIGIFMGLVLAFTVVTFTANQMVAGFAIAFLAGGLAKQIGSPYAGKSVAASFVSLPIPILKDIPFLGRILFQQDIIVYIAYLVFPFLINFVVLRTKMGLSIRACGVNPAAADSLGVSVSRVRYLGACFAGAMAGVAGAYLILAFAPAWYTGIVDGKGWIAFALVMFSSWRPSRLVVGAIFFGVTMSLGYVAQVIGWGKYAHYLNMLPYLATIALIILPTLKYDEPEKAWSSWPAALGTNYIKEEEI